MKAICIKEYGEYESKIIEKISKQIQDDFGVCRNDIEWCLYYNAISMIYHAQGLEKHICTVSNISEIVMDGVKYQLQLSLTPNKKEFVEEYKIHFYTIEE